MSSRKTTLLGQTFQTFASMFGVMFINVFSAVILSRGLSPDDRGVYLGVTMWNGFILGLCDVGMYLATVYLLGKCKENEQKDVFTTLVVWALATGVLCVLLVAVFANWMIKGHLSGTETTMAYLLFASSAVGPLTIVLTGVLASEQRLTLVNLVRVSVPTVLTTFWLVYFASGTLSIAMCLLTTAIIPFLGLLPLLWQVRSRFKSLGRFRLSIFKSGIWYGLRGYGGSVIHVMGNSGSQLLVFALSPAALAFFQTASSATGVLWAIPAAIGITSFPNMVKTDHELLHEKVCRFFRLTFLGIMVGAIMLGLAEPVLFPLLFGSSYMSAVLPGLILLPSTLFGGLSDLLGGALSSTGRTLHNTVAGVVCVGTTLGSMMLTLNVWGITGAALSTLIGFVMSFAVRLIWYHFAVRRVSARDLLPTYSEVQQLLQVAIGGVRKVNCKLKGKISVQSR